jgi:hypothetical protein
VISVGVLGDVDDSEKLLDLASGVSELTVAVVLLVVSLGCLNGQLINLKHKLLALTIERLAVGHKSCWQRS